MLFCLKCLRRPEYLNVDICLCRPFENVLLGQSRVSLSPDVSSIGTIPLHHHRIHFWNENKNSAIVRCWKGGQRPSCFWLAKPLQINAFASKYQSLCPIENATQEAMGIMPRKESIILTRCMFQQSCPLTNCDSLLTYADLC